MDELTGTILYVGSLLQMRVLLNLEERFDVFSINHKSIIK